MCSGKSSFRIFEISSIILPFYLLISLFNLTTGLYSFYRYHEDRMINYDHEDGVSVSSKLTSSILTVRNATARHGGNYTCAPANARQSSIYVHVLKGIKHQSYITTH